MASTSKVNDNSDDNTAEEELSSLNSDSDADVDNKEKQNNSAKNSDDDLKTKDEPEESNPEKKGRKLKSRRRRKLKRRETSSLDRVNSVETVSEKSALSSDGKKLRKRKQQKLNKFFIDPNGAIERKLEQKYVELEGLLSRQFVERKTNLTHLHIGQMEVLRQQYNLSCHGLPPTGVPPYSEGPRRRPHSAHHTVPAWDGESDEAYSAIRQIQTMSKFPEQKRKVRSKSAKSRRETYSDTESHRQNMIDINLDTASLSSARSPRGRKKRGTSSDHGSRRSLHSRDSTSPSLSPSRGYIPTDNQLRDTDNKRIKEWLRKKNIEHRKQRAAERAEKKEKRKESILKENEKIVARESGRSKVEEWMNRKKREAIEQKKAEKIRHRQLEEEHKEREAKKKMEFVQGKSWMRPASAPASRSKGKGLLASSTDDPSTSTDSQSSRPVPHPPSSKLMYKRSSAGRVRLRARSSEKVKCSDTDTKPPTEKSLEASQLSYSEWLERKRMQDAEKKKAEAEAKSKAAAKSDSDLENLLPDLHTKRVNKVLKSKKRVDSGLRSEDETQTSQDAESPVETLTVSGAKAELTTRNSYPRPQSAKLPSPQPCKSPKRPKSAHPRVDAIMGEEEKDESQENPFHLPFPSHLGLPTEVAKTQSKVFPERVAAERKSLDDKEESNDLVVINKEEEQIEENILEEPEDKVEQMEEESPRVGASFFKTDPEDEEVKEEAADPVNVQPPPAILEKDDTSHSFLDNSQEKLEPDKNDTVEQNGNNNNNNPYTEILSPSELSPGAEVNVTELPSERIPTLEVKDNEIPEEVIKFKEDIFVYDSSDGDSENDDDENDEDFATEQQEAEAQQIEILSTNEDDQQTHTELDANQVSELESQAATIPEETHILAEEQESVDDEFEKINEQSETTQSTMQITEQIVACSPQTTQDERTEEQVTQPEVDDKGDPVIHQEMDYKEDLATQQEVNDKENPITQQEADYKEDLATQQEVNDKENPITQQEADYKEDLATQQEVNDKENPVTQQEVDVTNQVPETVDEEIEEEVDDETMSQDENYFLDKRQSNHEPDKLEFLEQVMDSLPDVDDDSKGETSSLDEPINPDTTNNIQEDSTLDPSASIHQETPDDESSLEQHSQMIIETEPNEIPIADEPEDTNQSTDESVQTQSRDTLPQELESVTINDTTSSDTIQQQSEEHSNSVIKQHEDDPKLNPETEPNTSSIDSLKSPLAEEESRSEAPASPVKPLTPTLGRHLSNEELLANIQAGKKLISIPDSSEASENDKNQLTQLEFETPAETNPQYTSQITDVPSIEYNPLQGQTTQPNNFQDEHSIDQDEQVSTASDVLDQESELDAKMIDGQKQLKLTVVDQIGKEHQVPLTPIQDSKDSFEKEKAPSLGYIIPTELQNDSGVINEQKDLKQASLGAIANEEQARANISNNIKTETNADHSVSTEDSRDSEKDTRIITDQESLKAGTVEEIHEGLYKSQVAQSAHYAQSDDDNLSHDSAMLETYELSDQLQQLRRPLPPLPGTDLGNQDKPIDGRTQDSPDADVQAEDISNIERSEDTNDIRVPDKATDDAAGRETKHESDEEMYNNLQKRLHKLRSYDDDEFPVMHQKMHEPTPAIALGQEPDYQDSDFDTDTPNQSFNSTPEPGQGMDSQNLSDSFKRGLHHSTDGEREKSTFDKKEPNFSTDDQNEQPVHLQSKIIQDDDETEIPEELPSTEGQDNQGQFSPLHEDSSNQNGLGDEDQNSPLSSVNNETDTGTVPISPYVTPSTKFFYEEPSDTDSNESSDEVNNNKVKSLDNGENLIESLSEMKSAIDQTGQTTGDVSVGENEIEKLKNLENEFNLVPDNRDEQDVTNLNDNIKPILSSRDDNSAIDSLSSRQKKVSFSNRPIIIQEGTSPTEMDSDSDAVDDVLRTMI